MKHSVKIPLNNQELEEERKFRAVVYNPQGGLVDVQFECEAEDFQDFLVRYQLHLAMEYRKKCGIFCSSCGSSPSAPIVTPDYPGELRIEEETLKSEVKTSREWEEVDF